MPRNNKIFFFIFIILFIIFLLSCNVSQSSSGSGNEDVTAKIWQLDNSFGADGVVTKDVKSDGADNYLNNMVEYPGGRIYITGSGKFGGGSYMMYVGRYNSDGSLDTGFGTDGFFIETVASIGRDLAIDSNGRIVVAGRRTNGSDDDVAIWRLISDGSLDLSFDGNGYTVKDIYGHNDDVDEMVIDSSGRIVVTGNSNNGTDTDMLICRFTSTGALDSADFNNPIGYVTHDNAAGGNKDDIGNTLALDVRGRIIVAGRSFNVNNTDIVVWRYNSNGTLDTTFSNDGWASFNGGGIDEAYSLTIDADGKILVAGDILTANYRDMGILRYNADGSLDATFGNNGVVTYDYSKKQEIGFSISTDSDDNILVTGIAPDLNDDMALWMYDSSGSPVNSFGSNGLFSVDQAGGSDEGVSLLVDTKGRILVGGDFVNGTRRDIAIWRYVRK